MKMLSLDFHISPGAMTCPRFITMVPGGPLHIPKFLSVLQEATVALPAQSSSNLMECTDMSIAPPR